MKYPAVAKTYGQQLLAVGSGNNLFAFDLEIPLSVGTGTLSRSVHWHALQGSQEVSTCWNQGQLWGRAGFIRLLHTITLHKDSFPEHALLVVVLLCSEYFQYKFKKKISIDCTDCTCEGRKRCPRMSVLLGITYWPPLKTDSQNKWTFYLTGKGHSYFIGKVS